MNKLIVTVLSIIVILVFAGCSSSETIAIPSKTETTVIQPKARLEVKLDESILQAAIADSVNRPDWGINLGRISTNYQTGVKISGWVVLHNGDDPIDMWATIQYQPNPDIFKDSISGKTYNRTPKDFNPEWVTIGEKVVRLKRMETKAVTVSVLVPEEYKIRDEYWSLYVNVNGNPVSNERMELDVTTDGYNDNTVDVMLSKPLLADRLESLKEIQSSIGDNLTVTNYDAKTGMLSLTGLTGSDTDKVTSRLTILFEAGSFFNRAYNQIWLIKMLT